MNRRHKTGMSYFTVGVLALVISAVAIYLGFTKAIPFQHHFEVRAVFKTSNNLAKNSPVRIAGVNVGKVVGVKHSAPGDDSVTATLRIDKRGRPIHKDARVTIRPRIFLEGNFFVDLSPGTPSAPELGDGDVIPINQTASPVQFDQILGALQSDTRDDLKVLLREYSDALKGDGARGYRDSLKYWKGAYRDGAIVSEATLGEAEHDLSEYQRGAAGVAAALDRSPEQLKALISDFNTTAAAFARNDADLQATVAELPRTLRAAQPALASLNRAFPGLRALARDLRPGVRSSEPAIDASTPLVEQLRGLVGGDELRGLTSDLKTAIPSLSSLADATVPLYEQVRLASSCQNEVILPWTKDKVKDTAFPALGTVYEESTKPLVGLSGESRSGDANGQWFRVLAAGGTNMVTLKPGQFALNAAPIQGFNPPPPKTPPPLNADVPCETQQPPNLASRPGAPPEQKKLDVTNPKYKARYAFAKERAVKWLRGQLKREGLDKTLSVVEKDVTPQLVQRMADAVRAKQAARRQKILGAQP
jgi:phospholipid/cholesterol/gamma-HCH transport system substrate-binding protein